MPAYDYRCTECAHEFEVVQKFSDDPLTTCPECTGQLRKVFSAVGVVFKGSGFYSTDNRSRKSPAGTAPKPVTKSNSSDSSTKSETTSAPAKADAAAKPAAS